MFVEHCPNSRQNASIHFLPFLQQPFLQFLPLTSTHRAECSKNLSLQPTGAELRTSRAVRLHLCQTLFRSFQVLLRVFCLFVSICLALTLISTATQFSLLNCRTVQQRFQDSALWLDMHYTFQLLHVGDSIDKFSAVLFYILSLKMIFAETLRPHAESNFKQE